MLTNRKSWLIAVVAVTAVGALLVPIALVSYAHGSWPAAAEQGPYSGGNSGMWGMMGGQSRLSGAQLDSIVVSQPVSAANGTLTFSGDSIRILVLMGPMAEGQSMYSFVIDNLTNPTLVIPRGSVVTMIVANVDTDAYHGLTLTAVPPPYSYNLMPMMMSSFASSGVLPPASSGFASQQISFTVTGNMYYVCPVAGHAQAGMYGQIRAE